MEYVIQHVFADSALAARALAVNNIFESIARRALIVSALLACTYGVLAAEVELAKLEGFPAPIVR